MLLLAAPAGSGKTTLLTEWDAADPRPFGWVTIDDRDNDPVFLARTLATVLDSIDPVDPAVFDLLVGARPGLISSVIPRLAALVAARERPFVLVLDDFQLVSDPGALELIRALAMAMPEGSQLAVATRGDPGLKLGRLRAEGRLAEIGPKPLAMTRGEIAAFLEVAGIELGPGPLKELAEQTEGWPVAVYLAALSLADAPDADDAIRRFTGEDRVIADYLREELISVLEEGDRTFLIECSVLEQLDGEACDALLGRQGSAEDLRRLSQSNPLVIPLDRFDRDFRYHALLREMLLGELERRGSGRLRELQLRASGIYAERGDPDRAIEHAIASGDEVAAGRLLWEHVPDYASHGRVAGVAAWLARFGDATILASPQLALTQATLDLSAGDGAGVDRLTAAARAALEFVPEDERSSIEFGVELIAAAGGAAVALPDARGAGARARAVLPESDPWRSLACFIEGVALHLGGEGDGAAEALAEGARLGDRAVPSVRSLCLAQHALLLLDAGAETEAWALEERCAATVQRYGIDGHETQALVIAVTALIKARRGRVNDAVTAARQAAALIAAITGMSSWYEAEARIVLARALLQLDDFAGARRWLDEAEPHVRRAVGAPVLEEMLGRAREEAAATGGEARWPLTPAELRLLHLLPTHYSFREIAEQLYVSTNTVKSQARSIYRKLGVTSRAEAVGVAQAAGLIAGTELPGSGASREAAAAIRPPG